MAAPLEEIEFLARSANRIEVLATLADGAYSRRELGEAVDASQPTLGRVLNDLSDRTWIRYDGERYRATATGRLVAAGITDLRERLETETRLREVAAWLPDDLEVDLRHFRDATITTPTAARPNAPIRRMLELLRSTDRALLCSHSFNEQKLRLLRERVTNGEMTAKGVFTADAIDALVDVPDLRRELRALVDAPDAEIRVTTEDVPLAVEITADRSHLLLRDDEGLVRASVDTGDASVREWATALHERYWVGAEPVDETRLG
jgi:predicted transcriptional regulator